MFHMTQLGPGLGSNDHLTTSSTLGNVESMEYGFVVYDNNPNHVTVSSSTSVYRRPRSKFCIALITLGVVVVITSIALGFIINYAVKTDLTVPTEAEVNDVPPHHDYKAASEIKSVDFVGRIKITSLRWLPDLGDHRKELYRVVSQHIQKELNHAFELGPLADKFNRTVVVDLSRGSVIVDFLIILNSRRGIDVDKLISILVQGLDKRRTMIKQLKANHMPASKIIFEKRSLQIRDSHGQGTKIEAKYIPKPKLITKVTKSTTASSTVPSSTPTSSRSPTTKTNVRIGVVTGKSPAVTTHQIKTINRSTTPSTLTRNTTMKKSSKKSSKSSPSRIFTIPTNQFKSTTPSLQSTLAAISKSNSFTIIPSTHTTSGTKVTSHISTVVFNTTTSQHDSLSTQLNKSSNSSNSPNSTYKHINKIEQYSHQSVSNQNTFKNKEHNITNLNEKHAFKSSSGDAYHHHINNTSADSKHAMNHHQLNDTKHNLIDDNNHRHGSNSKHNLKQHDTNHSNESTEHIHEPSVKHSQSNETSMTYSVKHKNYVWTTNGDNSSTARNSSAFDGHLSDIDEPQDYKPHTNYTNKDPLPVKNSIESADFVADDPQNESVANISSILSDKMNAQHNTTETLNNKVKTESVSLRSRNSHHRVQTDKKSSKPSEPESILSGLNGEIFSNNHRFQSNNLDQDRFSKGHGSHHSESDLGNHWPHGNKHRPSHRGRTTPDPTTTPPANRLDVSTSSLRITTSRQDDLEPANRVQTINYMTPPTTTPTTRVVPHVRDIKINYSNEGEEPEDHRTTHNLPDNLVDSPALQSGSRRPHGHGQNRHHIEEESKEHRQIDEPTNHIQDIPERKTVEVSEEDQLIDSSRFDDMPFDVNATKSTHGITPRNEDSIPDILTHHLNQRDLLTKKFQEKMSKKLNEHSHSNVRKPAIAATAAGDDPVFVELPGLGDGDDPAVDDSVQKKQSKSHDRKGKYNRHSEPVPDFIGHPVGVAGLGPSNFMPYPPASGTASGKDYDEQDNTLSKNDYKSNLGPSNFMPFSPPDSVPKKKFPVHPNDVMPPKIKIQEDNNHVLTPPPLVNKPGIITHVLVRKKKPLKHESEHAHSRFSESLDLDEDNLVESSGDAHSFEDQINNIYLATTLNSKVLDDYVADPGNMTSYYSRSINYDYLDNNITSQNHSEAGLPNNGIKISTATKKAILENITMETNTSLNSTVNPCQNNDVVLQYLTSCRSYFLQIIRTENNKSRCMHLLNGILCLTDQIYDEHQVRCTDTDVNHLIKANSDSIEQYFPSFDPMECLN